MKIAFTLLFSIVVLLRVSGQTSTAEKQTKINQKSTLDKNITTKLAVEKDTVKKIKATTVIPEKTADSVLVYSGVFKPYKKLVHASYYADKFNGKRTTSGKKFDNNKYTAAHKKLPFGTKVRITNEKNGKSVVVEVIDRGPFVRSREIDLTKRAFMEIASNKASGGMIVTIEVLNN
ncbi:septal ring lytic transglycosylase RlpA family protein [Flavobacterium turcicum]|uniref:Probable endolytic peptidoglycan transglycosylase RlpA n=1 Tax=Flavobacterium turcicum TaxID=2764718 RepID=A0ABR7JCZ1_9FLAO|nr:septal ring lytic transglycosylase RlpA family protein [Flavobacterium turcicum]MBC5862136.1 septal ring lytic transglycosylase RlpA family protein [Flavobacterium turcicum]NHL00867.1 septal ring lytic transglycosylase RlpA family protein [Flavobacterium turcicum]